MHPDDSVTDSFWYMLTGTLGHLRAFWLRYSLGILEYVGSGGVRVACGLQVVVEGMVGIRARPRGGGPDRGHGRGHVWGQGFGQGQGVWLRSSKQTMCAHRPVDILPWLGLGSGLGLGLRLGLGPGPGSGSGVRG